MRITASIAGVITVLYAEGGCGSSRTCWYAIETGVSPVKGGRLVSISNITHAAE